MSETVANTRETTSSRAAAIAARPPNQNPCNQWRETGRCTYGARCKYRHTEEGRAVLNPNAMNPEAMGTTDSRRPWFESESTTTIRSQNSTSLPDMPGKKGVCFRWNAGTCTYGDRCRYSHAIAVTHPSHQGVTAAQGSTHRDGQRARRGQHNLAYTQKDLTREEATLQAEENVKQEHREKSSKEIERRDNESHRRKERKEETVRHKEEERLRGEEVVKRKREVELEAKRRTEARMAREQAQKEIALMRHQEDLKARREKEAAAIEQYVVSDSSLITCSTGMTIDHVVTGFDLCRIRIQNLPNDARRDEIIGLFTQQGVDIANIYLPDHEIRRVGNKTEAVVLATTDQGEIIALGLEGIEFRNETLKFEVSANASWSNAGSVTHTNKPFLTVSWWSPGDNFVVAYDSMERANERAAYLNGKVWKQRRIRVEVSNRQHGAIRIFGCPLGTADDIEFRDFVDSISLRRLPNSLNYYLEEVFDNVRREIFNSAGALIKTYEVMDDGKQVSGEARIKVHFADYEDARRVFDNLDKKRLPAWNVSGPQLRCWLPKPLQYSIKISSQQFEAQKKQWDELSEGKAGQDAHVRTRIDRGDVFIRVLGQDKKAAGALKVRVEGMVAGEKLDSTVYWHPSFAAPRANALFNRIWGETKVYVRHDFKTRSLRVYGDGDGVEGAKQIIKSAVDQFAEMEMTTELDRACVRGFMREGLGKLKELLQEENVTVNISTIPYKVTIKGGVEAAHHLRRVMDEARAKGALVDAMPRTDSVKDTCPLCFDEVSNPEELGCGHTYCSGCIHHFFMSAAEAKNFPLLCMGNEGQCKVPIAIPSIRRFMMPHAFQSLVEAAFALYLEQHAAELKYCTTPECKQIYRRRTDKTHLQCPSCFSTICPLCDNEAHEGMTCEERRMHQNPDEQERLNEELAKTMGFKKCPVCSILIEKTEGCNHITCNCGAHICWKCLGVFTEGTIYGHLQTNHQGIYDVVPAGVNHQERDDAAFLRGQRQEAQRLEFQARMRARHVQAIPAAQYPAGYGPFQGAGVYGQNHNVGGGRPGPGPGGPQRAAIPAPPVHQNHNPGWEQWFPRRELGGIAPVVQQAAIPAPPVRPLETALQREARRQRERAREAAEEVNRPRPEENRAWCIVM